MSSESDVVDGAGDSVPSSDPLVDVLRALVVALLLAVVGIGVGGLLVGAAVLVLFLAGVSVTPLLSIVISLALATGVGFGGVALGYLRYRGLGLDYVGIDVPSLRDVAFVVAGYVASFALLVLASVVISTVGAEPAPNTTAEMGMENPEILLLLIPASLLLIGPGEELLYRGVVQNRLSEALPAPVAIFLASLIFASIHFFSLSGAPQARLVSISVLVLPTLVFGTMYELTDNIVVPALIHGAYNATLFSLLYVTLQFMDAEQLQQAVLAF
ncbi:CPBP family intramembrane glutamic endopeptidase [Halobellus litoreus]|uniref:CPBP family intramembrane glutamic endopeptidase n=1 Tax=Halobellus litoreus TaxID=755310 RepID=A0ABD6DU43_9EURY